MGELRNGAPHGCPTSSCLWLLRWTKWGWSICPTLVTKIPLPAPGKQPTVTARVPPWGAGWGAGTAITLGAAVDQAHTDFVLGVLQDAACTTNLRAKFKLAIDSIAAIKVPVGTFQAAWLAPGQWHCTGHTSALGHWQCSGTFGATGSVALVAQRHCMGHRSQPQHHCNNNTARAATPAIAAGRPGLGQGHGLGSG